MTVELGNEFSAAAVYGNTPVEQMGANIQQDLNNVINPKNPIEVAADGLKAKLPPIEGTPTFGDKISLTGDTLRAPSGGSWLSDSVGMACAKLSQTPKEVAPVLENNAPPAQDAVVAAQGAKLEENTQHTKAAEQNFEMKPNGFA